MRLPKMNLEDTKNAAEIVAFLAAAVWFALNVWFRGQMDAAVELTVEAIPVSNSKSDESTEVTVELIATLKNVAPSAAGLDAVHWRIKKADSYAELEDSWLTGIEVPKPEKNAPSLILTQNATWRLSKLVKLQRNTLYSIEAWCHLGLQPASKVIRYQFKFST